MMRAGESSRCRQGDAAVSLRRSLVESGDLLKAVADTLVPGVSVEDDGALRSDLAPFARIVEARRPGVEFGEWSRSDREALVGDLLAEPATTVAGVLQRVLILAARSHYADPAVWPGLGSAPMQ